MAFKGAVHNIFLEVGQYNKQYLRQKKNIPHKKSYKSNQFFIFLIFAQFSFADL